MLRGKRNESQLSESFSCCNECVQFSIQSCTVQHFFQIIALFMFAFVQLLVCGLGCRSGDDKRQESTSFAISRRGDGVVKSDDDVSCQKQPDADGDVKCQQRGSLKATDAGDGEEKTAPPAQAASSASSSAAAASTSSSSAAPSCSRCGAEQIQVRRSNLLQCTPLFLSTASGPSIDGCNSNRQRLPHGD